MGKDPLATFGGLLRRCISDTYEQRERKAALESAGLLLLGMGCSMVTAYVLWALGVLV